jgi:hypothetical protein
MKAVIILALVAVAAAAPHVDDKRFIADTFSSLWHSLQNAINSSTN